MGLEYPEDYTRLGSVGNKNPNPPLLCAKHPKGDIQEESFLTDHRDLEIGEADWHPFPTNSSVYPDPPQIQMNGECVMGRTFAIAAIFASTCLGNAFAADPTSKNLQGTWVKSFDDFKLELSFTENKLNISVSKGEGKFQLDTDYSAGRDGTVFGRIISVKEEGITPATEKGDLFSMVVDVQDGKVIVKNLNGTNTNEDAKKIVEGEYKKK